MEQTKAFLDETADRDAKPKIVIHDRDTMITKQFTEALANAAVKTNPLPKACPSLNGRCERFIGSIKWECLDRLVTFGKRNLDYLLTDSFRTTTSRAAMSSEITGRRFGQCRRK